MGCSAGRAHGGSLGLMHWWINVTSGFARQAAKSQQFETLMHLPQGLRAWFSVVHLFGGQECVPTAVSYSKTQQ